MNVVLEKQINRSLQRMFIDVPVCRNCVHVLQKDVSFYCNKFKTFALFARYNEKQCGIGAKHFERKSF
jgi:hypothetical protein